MTPTPDKVYHNSIPKMYYPDFLRPCASTMAEWSNSVLKNHFPHFPHVLSYHSQTTTNSNLTEPIELQDDPNVDMMDLTHDTEEDNDDDFEIDVCGIEEDVNENPGHEAPLNESRNVEEVIAEIIQSSAQKTSRSKRIIKPVDRDIWAWYDIRRADSQKWRLMQIYQNQLRKISSSIDNFGVISTVDIPKGQYIVEYVGKKIPTAFVEMQEKIYESQGETRDYMFTIDEHVSLDATNDEDANISKYFNHSCEPNSKSEIVIVDNQKHVVITAIRKIKAWEEITWCYNLPVAKKGEKKLPCKCGSKKCKRFLN